MEEESRLLVRELLSLKTLQVFESPEVSLKSASKSAELRRDGNALYTSQSHSAEVHRDILWLYSKSVAFAPSGSEELACAYGNRSALLLHLGRHRDCLSDIERALAVTAVKELREKLARRREQCLEALSRDTAAIGQRVWDEVSESLSDFTKLLVQDGSDDLLETLYREDSCRSVAVRHNEKYGRHLVATRDIRPGEIIFVEKPYINSFNTKKIHTYCGHCLILTWAGIPCDHCGWFMYCSEKCKAEAWEQYHDIECCCIFYILYFVNYMKAETEQNVCFDGICIRAMIKGLREAGGLKQLKDELKCVDRCTDKCTRGFSENGKFESDKFRSLYSLLSTIPTQEMKSHVTFAAVALICLAKFTKFFGKDYKFTNAEELIKNPDAIFIGSLLLKLVKISNVNSYSVINTTDLCKYSDSVQCRQNWCCVRGSCIVPIASLINNSCNPNVKRCFSDDQKFILYATQPIKKNSQICDSYCFSFYEGQNPLRQKLLKQKFNFKCDCIACKKNWPCYPILKMSTKELIQNMKLHPRELEIWQSYKNLIEDIENRTVQYDQRLLQKISEAIEKSVTLIQPSVIAYKIIYSLTQVFELLYGYKTHVFSDC